MRTSVSSCLLASVVLALSSSVVHAEPGVPEPGPLVPAPVAPPVNSVANKNTAQDAAPKEDSALTLSLGKAILGFSARVIAGFELQRDELTPLQEAARQRATNFEWFLSQARLTIDGSWDKAVSLQLDLDFSDN